jgi:RNA polymerase sigma-70 factor (ECF subfamily)
MGQMSNFDPQQIADGLENIQAKAEVEGVIRALDKLKEADRDVLTLSLVEGFGPREISEITEERENTVSVRLHRARARLRKVLHADNDE